MKRSKVVAWVMVALMMLTITSTAVALTPDSPYPDGVEVFAVGDHTCVLSPSGDLECFCSCDGTPTACGEAVTYLPTDTPDTPDTPTPEPPTPERERCNRGIGNGSENCDPGNSFGQGRGEGRRAGEDRQE